jgi:hypothetical protein
MKYSPLLSLLGLAVVASSTAAGNQFHRMAPFYTPPTTTIIHHRLNIASTLAHHMTTIIIIITQGDQHLPLFHQIFLFQFNPRQHHQTPNIITTITPNTPPPPPQTPRSSRVWVTRFVPAPCRTRNVMWRWSSTPTRRSSTPSSWSCLTAPSSGCSRC